MKLPRGHALLIIALSSGLLGASGTPASSGPTAPIQSLYDALARTMKQGQALGFSGRLRSLDPELRRDYDLALMTRLVVGPPWRSMSAEDQQSLVTAFSDYSVAVYASRFKDYSGEQFVVDPAATAGPNGDMIVHTRLLPHDGTPVELDYLMRKGAEQWRIIDVLLNGTISELAERRSEYSAAVREGGAQALIRLLRQKTAQLAS